ncbi:MAG: hypothetical protein Q4B48_05435 [Syntrophomonadaceae bacterium]|nr:hypothetical protein [Syntrophomonadaceae bacterium]
MKRDLTIIVVISALVLGLTGGIWVRGIEAESTVEKRALASFPAFSLPSFVNKSYQSDLEQALSDQLVGGQALKRVYNKVKRGNTKVTVSFLNYLKTRRESPQIQIIDSTAGGAEHKPTDAFSAALTPRGSGLLEIEDSGHLVFLEYPLDIAPALLAQKADNINGLARSYPDIDFYCCYIETDVDIDFVEQRIEHEFAASLAGRLDERIHFSNIAVRSLEDYQRRFFKTDHHWNPAGQYEGYQQLVALLRGEGASCYETDTVLFEDVRYHGYKSRLLDDYAIFDTFAALKPAVPEHKVYTNYKRRDYGQVEAYEKGLYSPERGFDHYGACNGPDCGLVEFRFDQPEKGNLLVVAESFSNPINRLIAAHYNNAYIIDLRNYEKDCGRRFDFGDFVAEHDVDQVLFLGYYYFYVGDAFLIED